LEQARHFSNEVLIGYYEAMMQRPDRTDLLRTTNLPVLFIMGRHDTAVPLADSLAQCYLPQLAYIHVLERSGHMGMVEEPEQSNAFLYHFLSETSGEQ
jgi:pimeloyl-ACP methyl ester carboxylesterase